MECNRWNEMGLLYSSGELNQEESREFETHLKSCKACTKEYEQYRSEQETFFSAYMLEEEPSETVSQEILKFGITPVKPTFFTVVSPYFKHAFFALVVLMIGYTGGAYFTGLQQRINGAVGTPSIAVSQDSSNDITVATSSDSLSQDDSTSSILRSNGAVSSGQGVVPVGLSDE